MRRGEHCLLLTDTGADATIVDALSLLLYGVGADAVVVEFPPVELPGDEPPAAAGAAMLHADVIFELTSVFAGSSDARRTACAAGARYLTLPGVSWTTLRPGGPFSADFAAVAQMAKRIGERIDEASEFSLTSPNGTNLRGSFEGRSGRPLWGLATEPGGYAAPPDIEVGSSPVEGSVEGTVVIDGSLLFLGPNQLASPIHLTFEAGLLKNIAGAEAWRLTDALERAGDDRMLNLAEVSIGLNPFSRPGGSALELEGIVGSAHVALGNNIAYGGCVAARSHIDCVLLAGTLSLDGVAVEASDLPSR